MKKHLLIMMLLSLSTLLSAQEAKKFLTEGKEWKCITSNYSPLHDEGDTPFTVKVVGDTVCDGRTMKKLHIEYEEGVKGFYSRNVAAYEEGGRLHAYDSSNEVGPDILLIDMNLKVGDPILGGSCHVSAVDTICVDGIARKRITIGNDAQSAIIWVEGIGSNVDLWFTPTIKHIGEYSMLMECYDNGKKVFSNTDFSLPATSSINQPTADPLKNGKAYDLSGRRINPAKHHGVYIRNGVKRIAK
ncbi:hypothetical protein [Prevotella sp.]|mgnify:FL=1|jgi:hypothetical protein|uniref:hypothetical protein n=1 Tax=Prevotella sp. TaxID=59823 RepID=UPI00307B6CF4